MTSKGVLNQAASVLDGLDWLLVGGAMVEQHCLRAGVGYTRATHDVDLVVNPERGTSVAQVAERLKSHGFNEQVPLGENSPLHRFTHIDGWHVDVMTKDRPRHQQKLWKYRTVECPGSTSALGVFGNKQAKERLTIKVGQGSHVQIPNIWSAIALKGHAFRTSTPAVERHAQDVFALLACADLMGDYRPLTRSERRAFNYVVSSDALTVIDNWTPLLQKRWGNSVEAIKNRREIHDLEFPIPVALEAGLPL